MTLPDHRSTLIYLYIACVPVSVVCVSEEGTKQQHYVTCLNPGAFSLLYCESLRLKAESLHGLACISFQPDVSNLRLTAAFKQRLKD